MDRFDTDLWKFLNSGTEKSLGISDRLKLADKFLLKVDEIKSKNMIHRDLKPQNVLINLNSDGKWNEEMEITDFGIAIFKNEMLGSEIKAGTSGWAKGYQFTGGFNADDFAARLLVFTILLSWNKVWSFIWDGTTSVNWAHPIEKLFMKCKEWKNVPKLISEIRSRIDSQSFLDEWALYCRSSMTNIHIDSNTQKSIDIVKLFSDINLNMPEFVTNGTKVHCQNFTNLCHSFAIVTGLRRELANVMVGKMTTRRIFKNKTPLEVLNQKEVCSFSNFMVEFVAQISPRSLHGLAGRNSNQSVLSAQFCDLEKAIRRLVYPTRAFEKAGWKRMRGVKEFFEYFRQFSFHDTFELAYSEVGHPNSATNAQFYPTAVSLGILASPLGIPPTTFDSALGQKHYVLGRD